GRIPAIPVFAEHGASRFLLPLERHGSSIFVFWTGGTSLAHLRTLTRAWLVAGQHGRPIRDGGGGVDIKGIEGMSSEQISLEIQRGGKFVVVLYTISVLVMKFRRGSDVYFVKAGESAVGKGLSYSLLTLVAGWWGIPWGPIYTIGSLITNLSGGKDVTSEIVSALRRPVAAR